MLSCACPLCHKALGAVVVHWVVYHNFVITVDEKGSLGVLNRLSVVNALEEDRVKAAHEAFSLARALLEEFVGRVNRSHNNPVVVERDVSAFGLCLVAVNLVRPLVEGCKECWGHAANIVHDDNILVSVAVYPGCALVQRNLVEGESPLL